MRFDPGGVSKKTSGMMATSREKDTRLAVPDRAPAGDKAGPLCVAAARGVPVCCLRSVGCGTDPVPVPVADRATSLVVPADFAARPDKVASGPAVGRPTGGRGGLTAGQGVLTCTRTRGFFPVGFTPCGHFFKDEPAVCSARFCDGVFSPGFW